MWENIVLHSKVEVKGLFAGHFHSHDKNVYTEFNWLKDNRYNPKILSILYVCPAISIKTQIGIPIQDTARGFLDTHIDATGETMVHINWMEIDESSGNDLGLCL